MSCLHLHMDRANPDEHLNLSAAADRHPGQKGKMLVSHCCEPVPLIEKKFLILSI